MVDILPFVGTRYAVRRSSDLERLLTPPYDVITPKMQEGFYEKSPHNLVRVDFGKQFPDDTEDENRYTRSEQTWEEWKKSGIVEEDPKKAFYVYEQEFTLPDGTPRRRRGFFTAVRLQDFAEGGIRAHEQTFAGPKADRFRLMRATRCNLSPIFCLFDDPEKKIDELLANSVSDRPIQTRFDGLIHRLWILNKTPLIETMIAEMADKTLFIADGHHRYETSLLYRDEMRKITRMTNGPKLVHPQPFDYTMMYLNNIHDEGLVILPTHRILSKEVCVGIDIDEALEDLGKSFDVSTLELDSEALETEARRYAGLLADAGARCPSFIMLRPKGRAWLLSLKAGIDLDDLIDEDLPGEIKGLDVSILHRLVINRILLGNPEIELDHDDVHYVKDGAEALRCMTTCRHAAAFLLNPTRIEQVCQVAGLGLRMPHKSTNFYPKLVTGMVLRDLNSPWSSPTGLSTPARH